MDDDMMGDDLRAKEICTDLYGACSCVINKRPACEAMIALVDEDNNAYDERQRICESVEP